jgi:hypothetical protein
MIQHAARCATCEQYLGLAGEADLTTAIALRVGTFPPILSFNRKRSGDNASSIFETIAFKAKDCENWP